MNPSTLPSTLALAMAASLLSFGALAQSSNEPPVDPPTPLDTAPPTIPADPADPVNPIDPAHPWTPPEAAQDQPVTITSHAPDSVVGEYEVDFDTLDSNGDGYITRDEARGNEVLTAEFHVADSNGDGRLSREELSGWLR